MSAQNEESAGGEPLGPDEAISPERALALFLAPLHDPGGPARRLVVGGPADLCVLDRPWADAREDLADVDVHLVLPAVTGG